jgi:predicted neuraminidase
MKKIFVLIAGLLLSGGLFAQAAFEKAPITYQALLFPPVKEHVHGSSIVSLPNGDLLTAWFQGSGERSADDVKIMGARMVKGNGIWSAPFLLADTPDMPDCNPVLFLNRQGKLFLVWIAVQANKWQYSLLKFRTSVNYNQAGAPVWQWQDNILLKPDEKFALETESKFRALPNTGAGWSEFAHKYDQTIIEASQDIAKRSLGWMTRIKPLVLNNGRILLPLYSDGYNFSLVAISDDDGTSWHPSLPIISRGGVQPALAQKKNQHIMAYMRDNGDDPGRVQLSESADLGNSWSAAVKSNIPNAGSSVELLVLQDGRWAFISNDQEQGRHKLSIYFSKDEGITWPWKSVLENELPGQGSFSYPSFIQSADGLLRITYSHQLGNTGESIKYVVIDPTKIVIDKK